MTKFITMHGTFEGSSEVRETEVHPDNIAAFKRSGWVEGSKFQTAGVTYSLEDSIAQLGVVVELIEDEEVKVEAPATQSSPSDFKRDARKRR